MKPSTWNAASIATLALFGSLRADVIYSDFKGWTIPTDFTGLFVDVDGVGGWDLNPFFGGVGVANTAGLQPARVGTGSLDDLDSFTAGDLIDGSLQYATGSGGSSGHLGTTFTAGTEGYLGFKLGANHGWMRVVFTANTAGAVVQDWAYEDSGASITVGRIRQGAPSAGTQLVTLSPGTGEGFTLGSALTDTGGNVNSVLKTGQGTTTLSGTHTYSGTTTVGQGTLLVDGATTGSGLVSVGGGATLGGSGTIHGATTIEGIHAPGSSPGVQTFAGGISYTTGATLRWELTDNLNTVGLRGTGFDGVDVSGGLLSIAAGVTSELVFNGPGSAVDWTDAFWDSGHSWLVYDNASLPSLASGNIFDTISVSNDSLDEAFAVAGGTFTWEASGNDVYLVYTIPEPASAGLVAAMLGLVLLRRRR